MLKYFIILLVLIQFTYSQTDEKNKLDTEELGEDSTQPPQDCEDGECVEHYLCLSNDTLNEFGNYIIDDRFGGVEHDKNPKQCDYLQTCCASKKSNSTDENFIPSRDSFKSKGCGHRIVNGTIITNVGQVEKYTQFGEFPWVILILMEVEILGITGSQRATSGSLIHPKVVITTAHNIVKFKDEKLKARAGDWDVESIIEPYPFEDRNIVDILMHEHFFKPANLNDIALVFLEEPFELTYHIQTACLPPPNYKFDGSNCIATGWGKDSFGKLGKLQSILKKIEVPIVSNELCQERLRTTRLTEIFRLHPSFICAGGDPGVDACTGDGGAPLVCPAPNTDHRYYQAGIVSWGIGCKNDIPGVYVNVAGFREWIDKQFALRKLETSYYTL